MWWHGGYIGHAGGRAEIERSGLIFQIGEEQKKADLQTSRNRWMMNNIRDYARVTLLTPGALSWKAYGAAHILTGCEIAC